MDKYKVHPGRPIRLVDFDPDDTGLFDGKKALAKEEMDALNDELEALQELLYAEHKRKLLVVLQGMDTSGKDGLIRSVFDGVNPQGVKVVSFKAPTPVELDHDYLWRVHPHVPGRGEIVIFNRSHYEDVLIVRVRGLVPESVWRRRYRHIREFERMLTDEGVTLLKFYLHISKDEQKRRLQVRLDDPNKRWKFNVGDLKERARWDDYMRAYEDAINETSTEWAPWYVIPANKKWYRDWVAVNILLATLRGFEMRYPQPKEDLSGIVIE